MHYEIARDLLKIKAVQIQTENQFTWTSGIKSPIYCDNRLTISYPHIRKKVTKAFVQLINKLDDKPDVIAGCATAGIPHAAWLAEELELPMVYIRSTAKGHGQGNQIEGVVKKGQRVIVIEDLISTGGSALSAAKVLVNEELDVIGTIAIFTYGLNKSIHSFREANISLQTISNFDYLLDVLVEDKKINNDERKDLLQWRNNLLVS